MSADALVQIRQLVKHYTRGKQTVEVLHGIDLDIPKGDFVALMGPSGSGKTIIMVTHDPKAAEFATHTVHLDKGRLVEDATAH